MYLSGFFFQDIGLHICIKSPNVQIRIDNVYIKLVCSSDNAAVSFVSVISAA